MAYEKMPCLYDTQKDLHDRLHNTIVRYRGIPVMVQVESAKSLLLKDTVSGAQLFDVKPDDPDLDISSAEVGYLNWQPTMKIVRYYNAALAGTPNVVNYLERCPNRMYRQGLVSDSLKSYKIDGTEGINPMNLLNLEGFRASLTGLFPSLELGLELIANEKWPEVAISQSVAIKKTDSGMCLVYYRRVNVGWIIPRSRHIEMMDSELKWVVSRLMEKEGFDIR